MLDSVRKASHHLYLFGHDCPLAPCSLSGLLNPLCRELVIQQPWLFYGTVELAKAPGWQSGVYRPLVSRLLFRMAAQIGW